MANRLTTATSPYLLQHADNPVDWWEWCPEAFEAARARDLPILLSVGYSACHWCHVMAHESFEDEATAAYLNANFVSIKVDREERPDVDAIYMQACVAMTGQGGWPMTVVLDHEAQPFFAGTYFPPTPRHGQPAFTQVLQALSEAWQTKRDAVDQQAASLREHLESSPSLAGETPVSAEVTAGAVRALASSFDGQSAGFGGAPKFPPSMLLEFLLRHSASGEETAVTALDMVTKTCDAMARGGLYDQLGGGFARYSVDSRWVVPHFEKMLYDNGLLISVYAGLYAATHSPLAERVVRESIGWLNRELRTEQGAYAAALDADSDGAEGTFYVWTPAQLDELLGDDADWAKELFEVTAEGTFEHGSSTLQLLADPDEVERYDRVRRRLRAARGERTRPHRDDKVVAAWNGLAISALARAGMVFRDERWVAAAVGAGEFLWSTHWVEDRLRRVSRDGAVGSPAGVLDDYGCVADGFVALAEATGEQLWLDRARTLLDVAITEFAAEDGGFFDTAADAEALIVRPRDPSDNASPSGLSALVNALIRYAALAGSPAHRDVAERALASVDSLLVKVPRFAGHLLAAAELILAGPLEIVVVGDEAGELARIARAHPSAVSLVVAPGSCDIPLAQNRPQLHARPTAYVCRGMVCDRPVTEVDDLAARLLSRCDG